MLGRNNNAMSKINAIELDLSRNGLNTILKIKVAPAIEEFFKQAVDGRMETSSKWLDENGDGLRFYKKSETMSRLGDQRQVIDNFGNGLLENNGSNTLKINVAPLRIVGASSENGVSITTDDLLSYEEQKQYIKALAEWAKIFYENDLQPAVIAGKISFEV
mgnify:FL=1